jgi:hypothetical protein
MKIVTHYETKPFHWTAVTDEYSGPGSPIGSGGTEEEAIANLMAQLSDEDLAALAGDDEVRELYEEEIANRKGK